MKMVLTRDLVEGDILSKDLVDSYGNIILRKGAVLTQNQIDKLKKLGIIYVILQEVDMNNGEQSKFKTIKDTMVKVLPDFFNSILCNNRKSIEEEIIIVDEMVDYIICTGEINTNIFDLKNYDDYTYIHSVNTCIMATFIGLQMEVEHKNLKKLALGAILHDIGKMKLPLSILNKKGKLTSEEFDEIKKHSKNGSEILKEADITEKIVLDIVLQHHERVDGKGYPNNLFNDEISDYAKIVTLCDVFTALTSNRSYRKSFRPNDAYEFIISNSNIMFEPKVVKVFKDNFPIYPKGCKVKISNGMEGIVIDQNKGFPDRPIIDVYYKKDEIKKINLLDNIDLVITEAVMN